MTTLEVSKARWHARIIRVKQLADKAEHAAKQAEYDRAMQALREASAACREARLAHDARSEFTREYLNGDSSPWLVMVEPVEAYRVRELISRHRK